MLVDSWLRADVKRAVADAGFDSEEHHALAQEDLGVENAIPPDCGRPTEKPPSTPCRAEMRLVFNLGLRDAAYGQRWQAETDNAMLNRDDGSARTPVRREREMCLPAIVHNLTLPPEQNFL